MKLTSRVTPTCGAEISADPPEKPLTQGRKRGRRKAAVAVLIASLVALAVAIGWFVWKGEPAPDKLGTTKGIAVLPFENLSADPDNAYFADGVQEEIHARLAKITDLKVISDSSTRNYQTKPTNLARIAKQLGVRHVLQGSVRKAPDRVRVNVQLINVQTNSQLWADTYDRKFD